MKTSIPATVINSAELDGCGKLMLSIVTKCARKTGINTEDLYQEAIIYYLKHRHKWDSSRGARTTFVHQLMRSFCNWQVKALNYDVRRINRNQVVSDRIVVTSKASPWLDTDAQAIVDTGLTATTVGGVAKQMRWKYERAASALEEMRQAYSKRIASKVWIEKESV